MIDLGINLSDEAVRFIPSPDNSPCYSFSATESHLFFGHIRGEITVCCMNYRSLSTQVVAKEKILQPSDSSLEHSEKISNDSRDSLMVDCICACPYTSVEEIFLSVLHGHHTLTFVKFNSSDTKDEKANSLSIYRSVELRLADGLFQYTNRATAHFWLDNDTFLVGCLDGTVLAVSATVEVSAHVFLREDSPIIQISWDNVNNVFAISSVGRSFVAIYNDGSLNISPIGSKPREEGVFGACVWPLKCTVYAARHNARIFEYNTTSNVVSRTYRIPQDAELGILRPLLMLSMPLSSLRNTSVGTEDNIRNGENGEKLPFPIFLYSEGPIFLSVLVLTSQDVCHVTRRFTDLAVVSTVLLSSWALVLCSNGYLMCVPSGSNLRQSQQCSDDNPTSTLGHPSIEPDKVKNSPILN
ncbi:hypothetical protein LSM04_003369 [Trypanosoma melophagium]|uniref:uncharacterized protein n=1 Tax=Trypanosoma melophagium TaxID=715481 RepID=UPI00351A8B2D|nr:hypothetical protein LSM04_003369 [Trypanosoma melophagium]